MENSPLDLILSTLSILGFSLSFLLLLLTVLPQVIRESRVQNGLAKLRRQLLVMVASSMFASLTAVIILTLSVLDSDIRWLLEFLIVVFAALHLVNASAKYRIYHEQYTEEHKQLSAEIQKKLNQKGVQK